MGIRDFIETKTGRTTSTAFVVVMIAAAGYAAYSQFHSSDEAEVFGNRVFMDAETGQVFKHKLVIGEKIPLLSPFTGRNTAYEPERCYWTKDGHVKSDPTYVLLNEAIGKSGPTFCPDCGRLVVHKNPQATETATPPPTKEQYR